MRGILIFGIVLVISTTGLLALDPPGPTVDTPPSDDTAGLQKPTDGIDTRRESKTRQTGIEDIQDYYIDDYEPIASAALDDSPFGGWGGEMAIDEGLIFVRPVRYSEASGDSPVANKKNYCLGVKVEFMSTGFHRFSMKPARPIKIPGITKTLKVQVAGRQYRHELRAVIRDYQGNLKEIPFKTDEGNRSDLNFSGWKSMSAQIPVTVEQEDFHDFFNRGISLVALLVKCDAGETSGKFFMYIDEFVAETDMFDENRRREMKDMIDNW